MRKVTLTGIGSTPSIRRSALLAAILAPFILPSRAAISDDTLIKNSIGMYLRYIPAGEFEMGNHEDAISLLRRFDYVGPDQVAGEWPVHKVRITRPFYMGVYEVTLGEFLKFYHATGYKLECERDGKGGEGWTGEGWAQRPSFVPWSWGFSGQTMQHPVVNVTWNDAQAFCQWLSRTERTPYRLPTEAEWEYACRAGSNTRYSFGTDPEDAVEYANVADQSGHGIWPHPEKVVITKWENGQPTNRMIPFPFLRGNDGYAFTSPVGTFKPNAFGLCDIYGNVWEWCSDWYGGDYYEKAPQNDPQGPSGGSTRVTRSGSCRSLPVQYSSAFRGYVSPNLRGNDLGFRVVRSPSEGR